MRFQDFPVDREDGLCSIDRMLEAAEGVKDMLKELKEETFEKYDAFTVGEVFNNKEEELYEFIGKGGYFSTMFDFEMEVLGKSEVGWSGNKAFTPNELRTAIFESQIKTFDIGFKANIIENHDEPRGVSHYIPKEDLNDESKKMLAAISLMSRGIPFIYQGQELGMTNSKFNSIKEFDDISTIDQYDVALKGGCSEEEALEIVNNYSRDNARTPFQWENSENAGFTIGKPWIKVNENYKEINTKSQLGDEDSVFNFYKALIKLRKSEEFKDAVVYGTFEAALEKYDKLFAFYRKGSSKRLMLLANYQNEEQIIELPNKYKRVLINNYKEVKYEDDKIILQGYQVLILEVL